MDVGFGKSTCRWKACFELISVEPKIVSIKVEMTEIWPLEVSVEISTQDDNCADIEGPAHTLRCMLKGVQQPLNCWN